MNAESVLPILLELLVKSALITLGAAGLAVAWRGATAAQRHLVWLVALAVVLLLPVTRLVTPRWAIPIQPATKVMATLPGLSPVAVTHFDADPVAKREPVAAAAGVPLDWRKILLGFWLCGTVFLLGYRLFGSWRLRRLWSRSIPLDDARIRILFTRTLSELGLRRRPKIRLSEECRVPVTWGSLRPVMLLPTGALDWSDAWVAAALRHEAAHIRRDDYLTRWLAHVACAVYWPNPLVWFAARSLRGAQERAADDLVLQAGTAPEEYAAQLVAAARTVVTHGLFVRQAVAMASSSKLEDRVRAIVGAGRDRRPLSRLAAGCGFATVASALVLSSGAQLRSAEQKPIPAIKVSPTSLSSAATIPPIPVGGAFLVVNEVTPETLMTEEWKVPPNLLRAKPGTDGPDRESAKEWLIEKGVVFKGAATALYVVAPGRLIVRNTADQLDLVDVIVNDATGQAPPAPSPLLKKLDSLNIPKLELREASPAEALDFPRKKSADGDPDKTGTLQFLPDAVVVQPSAAGAAGAAPGPEEGAAGGPAQAGPAVSKAGKIIIPKIEFREATVPEVVEFLRQKALELDPEKIGLKILLKPGAESDAKLTLMLTNIPLIEAIRYVAGLGNLKWQATPDGFVLEPLK